MAPFEKHQASLGDIDAQAGNLESLASKAIDLNAVTRAAFDPATASWQGICSAELQSAPEPVRAAAQESSGALAWAAAPLRYWAAQVRSFHTVVDRVVGSLATAAGNDYSARGTGGAAPTAEQIASAKSTAESNARQAWYTAHNTYVVEGAAATAGMFRDGPTEQNLAAARAVGAIPATPGVFSYFATTWHEANMRTAARDAKSIIDKINSGDDPPTQQELNRLRDLLGQYAADPAFAYLLLRDVGPRGLIELTGNLAFLVHDDPSVQGSELWDEDWARSIGAIQASLGVALATATTSRGTGGDYPTQPYTPGAYELGGQWVADLMVAGREKIEFGGANTAFGVMDLYGYQLVGVLLNHGSYDSSFLATVGGDIIDFEMDKGDSVFWKDGVIGGMPGQGLRLDWTDGWERKQPAGFDPMIGLMDALERNPDAAKDVFTNVTRYEPGGPDGGRLPRLDYLLTDREWPRDFVDTPRDMQEYIMHRDEYVNPALDKLGIVLERAATVDPDERSVRIVESIVYEINVDEQAMGYDNGDNPNDGGDTKKFAENNLIPPVLRDSMATIMEAYIFDVNRSMDAAHSAMPGGMGAQFDSTHMTRFLADLGKDSDAHATVVRAETAYVIAAYDHYLSGAADPNDDLAARMRSLQNVSDQYGNVVGALDYGAAAANHQTSADADADYNGAVKDRYMIAGFLVDQVVGQGTSRIPVPVVGDLASAFVDGIMSAAEQDAMVNNTGRSDFQIGEMMGASRTTMTNLVMMSMYESGQLPDLPPELREGDNPKPVSDWDDTDLQAWQSYLDGPGNDTVVSQANGVGGSYDTGYGRAQTALDQHFG